MSCLAWPVIDTSFIVWQHFQLFFQLLMIKHKFKFWYRLLKCMYMCRAGWCSTELQLCDCSSWILKLQSQNLQTFSKSWTKQSYTTHFSRLWTGTRTTFFEEIDTAGKIDGARGHGGGGGGPVDKSLVCALMNVSLPYKGMLILSHWSYPALQICTYSTLCQ